MSKTSMHRPSRHTRFGRSAAAVVGVLALLGALVLSASPAAAVAEQRTFVLTGSFDVGATHIDIPSGATWTATVDSVTGAVTNGTASIPTLHVPANPPAVPVATDITISDAVPSTGTLDLATGAITLASQFQITIAIPGLATGCGIGPITSAPSTAKAGGSNLTGTPAAATLTDAGFTVPTVTPDAANCAISGVVDSTLGLPTTSTALSLTLTQATTDVYLVHGLNLEFQDAADQGGTNVTVCSGTTSVVPDLQFGDVAGPIALASGEAVSLQVYLQEDGPVDCATADPGDAIIDQDVTPEGAALALVVTAPPGDGMVAELADFPLDVACSNAGQGRLVGVHAAAVGPVEVQVDGTSAGTVAFGNGLSSPAPAGTYSVAVLLDGEPILGPTDTTVQAGVLSATFVVGGQPVDGPTPIVGIPLDIVLTTCTAAPPAAPPATPAAAAASFTG